MVGIQIGDNESIDKALRRFKKKYERSGILKEFKKKDLRSAETDLSEFVVGERVDHSVINYWERKPEIANCLNDIKKATYILVVSGILSVWGVLESNQ